MKTFFQLREEAGQVTVGDYTTKHFDICPSAVKLYSNIKNMTPMVHLVVENMMLHDLFFRLEKQAIAQGSIDMDDLEKADHYAEMIMDNAEQMGLEEEHSYIEDVHMAKFEQLAGMSDDEEEDDESEMNEKTLTKAELKKRKEVADAIKRENPNMPMAKKMAIATATAKRVAEEAEQIDEISRDLARRYIRKATADNKERRSDVMKPFPIKDMDKNVSQFKKMKSREKGIETAGKKAYDIGGKAKVPARESVELDELSKNLLRKVGGKMLRRGLGDGPKADKHMKSANLASAKLYPDQYKNSPLKAKVPATESVTLDELSKKTLGTYVKKAAGSAVGLGAITTAQAMSSKGKADPDDKRQLRNRMTGVSRATDRLTKEEAELNEISRDLATRAAQGFADKADAAHNKKDYAGFKKGEAARKMAIAKVQGRAKVSAVARRVEETELDEVSSTTLMNYSIKAARQGMKRVAGQKTADEKMRKKDGYSSTAKVAAGPARRESVELDEGISNLSHSRLKFHATKGVPHGSYSNKEIKDEHNRRMRTEPDYVKAKASLGE